MSIRPAEPTRLRRILDLLRAGSCGVRVEPAGGAGVGHRIPVRPAVPRRHSLATGWQAMTLVRTAPRPPSRAGGPAGRKPRTIRLRPLRRDTDPAVELVFAGMSAQSRYRRFHGPMPVLTEVNRRVLLDVDGRERAAIVAEVRTPAGWRPAGIARLVADGPTAAELAVEVADRWQGHGVGRRLLHALGDLAADLGYTELYGDVLGDNAVMIRLLRSVFPGSRSSASGGVVRVSCPVGWGSRPITDEDIFADLLG